MGDRKLTDFNSHLTQTVYVNSFDRPPTGQSGWQQSSLPAPTPAAGTTANTGSQIWYSGPNRLAPESMANIILYFREMPGARLEKIVKPLVYLGAFGGFTCLLLILGLITNTSHSLTVAVPAAAQQHGLIGILNPEWVRIQLTLQLRREWPGEYFSLPDGLDSEITLPAKFIYTLPKAAQRDLQLLIQIGAVNFDGGLPDVVKDFAQLKKLGITTD